MDDLPRSISALAEIDAGAGDAGDDDDDALPPPVRVLDGGGYVEGDAGDAVVESVLALAPRPAHLTVRSDKFRKGREMLRRTCSTVVSSAVVRRKCCEHFCCAQFSASEISQWQANLRRLDKPDQDQFLMNMVKRVGRSDHSWQFLGKRVCRQAAFRLSGASGRLKDFRRLVVGNPDAVVPVDLRATLRVVDKKLLKCKLGKLARDVDAYLRLVYWRAETLPDVKDELFDAEFKLPEAEEAPDELIMVYDQTLRAHEASSGAVHADLGGGGGERLEGPRYLQPGTWVEIFHLYSADRRSKGMTPASWTTFWRTWTSRWSGLLKHRDKFTHKKCSTCTRYKEILKSVSSFESRDFWCRHYTMHLQSQQLDRETYYHERQLSVDTSVGAVIGAQSTVTIIIDAAGCMRFKVPRHLPGSQVLGGSLRPTLTVVGVIAHGYHKAGYIMEPTLAKDSNMFCTLLAITLSKISRTCVERKLQFPSRVKVVFDNAGDNKNQWTFTMNAFLVGIGMYRLGFSASLRTGHSHEDIDAMFGNWGLCLFNQPTLQDPEEYQSVLARQFPDTQFDIISFIYDFQDILNETCIKLAGFGGSVGAAHSFCFVRRAHLDIAKYGVPKSQFSEPPNPDDVCLLVRKYMHVQELSQEPLVALTAAAVNRVRLRVPHLATVPRLEYSAKQQAELKTTADKLIQFPFRLHRAAKFLYALAEGTTHVGIVAPPMPRILSLRPFDSDVLSVVGWVAPTNLIEPPEKVKLVTATPVRNKKQLARKRGKLNSGKLKPLRGGHEPMGLGRLHGVVGLPEVAEYGDIVEVVTS